MWIKGWYRNGRGWSELPSDTVTTVCRPALYYCILLMGWYLFTYTCHYEVSTDEDRTMRPVILLDVLMTELAACRLAAKTFIPVMLAWGFAERPAPTLHIIMLQGQYAFLTYLSFWEKEKAQKNKRGADYICGPLRTVILLDILMTELAACKLAEGILRKAQMKTEQWGQA